ncbi:MAG: radical SAM family heme chaperone HemW [Dehalococcoidales bacterium]|nr:radical SAM family heme chaperone HemW [Dehalococcoidales bacterium]
MRGLYVHVPFCVRKCGYCDFYSLPGRADSIDAYINAVPCEARPHAGMSFSTLYLGGGTPSLLGPAGLEKLISGLGNTFNLTGLAEATMEVNPDSATAELLETARSAGIDRVSIGVQSLSDSELQKAGRIHSAERAIEAVSQAITMGFRTSADLIAGLPGQDWHSLKISIETLIDLGVRHLSLYCLSLEEGTPLAANPPPDLPSEDAQAELFGQATKLLKSRGFIHYEISNFAVKGEECLHNLNYWRGGEYLGLGPGAASHLDGKRYKNRPDLDAYLKDPTAQVEDVEKLDPKEKAAEEAMLRLRLLAEGLNAGELTRRFGHQAVRGVLDRLSKMAAAGWLTFDGSNYRLSPDRVLTSNPIFSTVLWGHEGVVNFQKSG